MDDDRFVVNYDENGNLIGGGGYLLNFPISSIKNPFKGGKKSNFNDENENDDSDKDEQYIIPAGLYYKNVIVQSYPTGTFDYKHRYTIDDTLYDSLYNLASFDENKNENVVSSSSKPKKNTRKNKNKEPKPIAKKGTRKHK